MWRPKVSFIGFLLAHFASGQDVIVNGAGDTLHCKITMVREDRILYSLLEDGRRSNEKISKADVSFYHQAGFAPVNLGPTEVRAPSETAGVGASSRREKEPIIDPVRIAISAGASYRTAPIPDEFHPTWITYYEGLRSGYHYGADLSLFFRSDLGVTLMFDNARWQHDANGMPYYDVNGSIVELSTSDDITVGILGPALTWRWMSPDHEWRVLMHLGAGYTWYKDEMAIADLLLLVRGEDVYLRGEVDGEFMLSEHVALGISFDYIQSTLSQLKVETGNITTPLNTGTKEGLQRIGLSGGIGFVF